MVDFGGQEFNLFFKSIKKRWNNNKILSITDEEGNWVEDQQQIKEIAVDYYTNLLGAPNSSTYPGHAKVADYITKHISQEHADSLVRAVTDEEVFGTLKSMKRNKSPGPDGFNNFFIHSWDIVDLIS